MLMIDDWLLSLLYAAWLTASTMPLGFMLGSSCSPCCDKCPADGKPRTDPKDEGTWVPSGTWATSVTWTFTANPGDESGETWFFFGSSSTSKVGGGATTAEQRDWGNICNWYSNKTTSVSSLTSIADSLDKRATRLPPTNAVVHIYSPVTTDAVGPITVKTAYFWRSTTRFSGGELSATQSAHDSTRNVVFFQSDNEGVIASGGALLASSSENLALGTVYGGATFIQQADNFGVIEDGGVFGDGTTNALGGVVNAGATFNGVNCRNVGTVNGGATFENQSANTGVVNDGATFDSSNNSGTVNQGAVYNTTGLNNGTINDGCVFNGSSQNGGGSFAFGTVNDGATFNDSTENRDTVNGSATFNDSSKNGTAFATVNDGATFNNSSENLGTVNGGATFNDSAINGSGTVGSGTVNGGATFNDAACSRRSVGNFFTVPCSKKFVAHPTDLPTCNGTAPDGCVSNANTCGCG